MICVVGKMVWRRERNLFPDEFCMISLQNDGSSLNDGNRILWEKGNGGNRKKWKSHKGKTVHAKIIKSNLKCVQERKEQNREKHKTKILISIE